jgi:hypothetical protein
MAKNLNLNIDLKNIDLKQLIGSVKNINLTSLKKYSSLFPSLGLLLVAGVIFVLTLLVGGFVSKKAAQSVQMSNEIRSQISQVPSEAQAAEAEQYYQKYAEDADRVDALAVRTSWRELVCYNPIIFPEPKDKSSQVYMVFGRLFRADVEKLMERIRAKDAPSDAEIRSRTGVGSTGAAAGGGYQQPIVPGGAQSAMVDALCLQRADEIPVYANPAIFSWYAVWDKYTYQSKEQSLQDCWYSQVAYWIYEDVIQTIEVLNAGSTKVSQSPVKRLLGVRFDGPVQVIPSTMAGGAEYMMMGTMGMPARAGQQQDIPTYVKGPGIFLPLPWTGRMCNDTVDVVHFAVSVVVDSKSAMSFMKELCSAKTHTFRGKFEPDGKQETARHNQITILQFHTEPVVREDAIHAYYRYGKNAVVRLNLVCEYLFIRQAYDGIKPEPIKKILSDQNTGQSQTGGGF